MKQRFEREVPESEANLLWTATTILMGMKYSKEFAASLLRGVRGMKESVTYQAIVEEGRPGKARVRMAKESSGGRAELILLRMGRKRLGEPRPEIVARIEAIAMSRASRPWPIGCSTSPPGRNSSPRP